MRLLAVLASALRAVVLVPVLVFEAGRWILRSVARPDPVLPATATAADYLDASAAAAPAAAQAVPHVGGSRALHPTGVALVMHARHLTGAGPAIDVSGLSDEVQVWLASLGRDELAVLAKTMPYEAQAFASGGADLPGLPPLRADAAGQESVTRLEEDASEEAEPAYVWPYRDQRGDAAMRDLLAHVERQHRRRVA
ncbi:MULTISPECIES: hypothetical protein [Methylorubrum]|uniref:Uncharacterized protein n=2 Tax=Methylorubrum TaxID=2282523 RepID=A0ABU9ZAV3_9HYPH|nr:MULTISPECIES: hypothetical protein [Methylorubrum]MBA8915080.1 hypothetical protein [Methylorubrum thiocyanatum]MBK3403572.1 hypothetical protein [Methylorubrum rhodesianum]MBY0143951.1 hypothetical protein [Methylorubrum populi]GJE79484.1 hypothetical protein CJNNKLLH_0810 [Methylorubrum thiocyanatum]